jgi:hypothetical protein
MQRHLRSSGAKVPPATAAPRSYSRSAWQCCASLAAGFALLGPAPAAWSVVLDDPANYQVRQVWDGFSLGLPSPLGGMLFSADGSTLYVVGASERSDSALYAVPVQRDPVTSVITNLGPASAVTLVFSGDPETTGLDAGLEWGPAGTLFYTYWPAHTLGQRPGGLAGAETLYPLTDTGLPSSIAGLAFSPHLTDTNTGFAQMQCSTWQGAGLFNVWLQPLGGGLFAPQSAAHFVELPRQGTGAIQYFPSGPLRGHILYVNWDYGEVMVLFMDPATGLAFDADTGLPQAGTANPIVTRIAHDLGVGPWGLEFDPLTLDFFVATWGGSPANSIIQIAQTGLPTSISARITLIERAGPQARIKWYGPAGWTHRLLATPDLSGGNWTPLLSVPNAPFSNERTIPIQPGARFIRVECLHP